MFGPSPLWRKKVPNDIKTIPIVTIHFGPIRDAAKPDNGPIISPRSVGGRKIRPVLKASNPKNPYKKSWDIPTYEESARMWYEECSINNELGRELGETQPEPAAEFYENLAKEMGFKKPWFENE